MVDVLRNIDKSLFQYDVLVENLAEYALGDEFTELGGQVLKCSRAIYPLRYAYTFFKILRTNGPYHIVHSHMGSFSGFVLMLAWIGGIPVRVAHAHSASQSKSISPLVSVILKISHRFIRIFANAGIGASKDAANFLFGSNWSEDKRFEVIHCGIDLNRLKPQESESDIKRILGINPDVPIVGHIGRFHEAKNHTFLVSVAGNILEKLPQVKFLLVGEGKLRQSIQNLVASRGISKSFIFTGETDDVSSLLAIMDCFILPSLWEGLPLSLIEAQAFGVPCVISDVISEESVFIQSHVYRLSVHTGAVAWADLITEVLGSPRLQINEAMSCLNNSGFGINTSVEKITDFYKNKLAENGISI